MRIISWPERAVSTGEFTSGSGSPRDCKVEGSSESSSKSLCCIVGKVKTDRSVDDNPGDIVHDGNSETK